MDQTNLEWQTFNGSLPNGAVSIYNEEKKRTDYVSKYTSSAGFYNPDKGPYCFYPYGDKELSGSPFEILVNKDNFEFLEWKDGSHGSVPQNAVETWPGSGIYVGKNQYGLGKVDVKNTAFFLPWEGKEHWYKNYQVLTVNKDVISEDISDIKYKTDGVKAIKGSPETMQISVVTNNECRSVKRTTTLSKTTQKETRWDTSFSLTVGAKTTITAGIPLIVEGKIELSAEATFGFTKGTTHTESSTHTDSVEVEIPPNHTCRVSMVGHKYEEDIPYTARLKRTYRNGKTTWASISGTYKSVQMAEIRVVVDRCEPIPNAKPCPLNKE
ncbi:natterin-3-like [Perca flavescens]|uniref:natterin-3-like n=1 Tax=Perca flavescens TaxID=8167 RepID=UPI00106EBCD9|nr:natterin-3-like [Perca flavescens]XP_028434306.1 natterin-3-like [Perca flavescens]